MLDGKVALITGGSQGIGKAIALKLGALGARIALVANVDMDDTIKELEENNIYAKGYLCDVSSFSDTDIVVKEIIKDFESIDILVNNAGITRDKLVLAMKEEDFASVISVNLIGTFNLIKHASSFMLRKRNGRIINIASVVALTGNIGQANYTASKAGIIGLTKTIAKEFAGREITCNAIAPGFIDTDMSAKIPEAAKAEMLKNIPLKRMGQTEDVANLVAFLASDEASYITGEVIRVDGGLAM